MHLNSDTHLCELCNIGLRQWLCMCERGGDLISFRIDKLSYTGERLAFILQCVSEELQEDSNEASFALVQIDGLVLYVADNRTFCCWVTSMYFVWCIYDSTLRYVWSENSMKYSSKQINPQITQPNFTQIVFCIFSGFFVCFCLFYLFF